MVFHILANGSNYAMVVPKGDLNSLLSILREFVNLNTFFWDKMCRCLLLSDAPLKWGEKTLNGRSKSREF